MWGALHMMTIKLPGPAGSPFFLLPLPLCPIKHNVYPMGLITHIVSFTYAPTVSSSEKHLIASSFLALKERCVLPRNFYADTQAESDEAKTVGVEGETLDGGRYIVECSGGCNNSPEGFSRGFEHTFILTFRNKQERDYYLDRDPAHQAFKEMLGGKLADDGKGLIGVWVFDFEAGVFE
ncbi:BZ3500_MvSof-1268-A1-R1_Chr1-1g01049 [Microbotryum saponariae]|uniref:BZ3500_MvSof-1268-A1-R1_Chr1-1g01049 protein n=1 Tax=Microbotryum saponariae TaxID=289078 RepID=A0A2X0KAH6_9BASI|nr:BZ3500_MvSof-1268-A1-R1_Chr1-1g01049 [Microbotryum saponariae]SCZ93293.1 BZ3501_MvSof-1269-A2-R1_Chr1-1g00646 [Microbotryum saponariae]